MTTRVIPVVTLVLALIPAGANAEERRFSEVMTEIQGHYAAMHNALAGDSLDGVDVAAGAIEKLSASLGQASDLSAQPEALRQLPPALATAAAKLVAAEGIAAKRPAFSVLSQPMVTWARSAKPEGLRIIHCSMAKATWLQTDESIRNPYYGASMLKCGTDVTKGEPEAGSTHDGH